MSDFYQHFSRSVRDPEAKLPSDVNPSMIPRSSRRFTIYRNNHFVSLVEALEAQFPVVQRILGPRAFHAYAREYAQHNPPTRVCMLEYGDEFPGFLSNHSACSELPYLADIARLELSCTHAENASDDAVVSTGDIKNITVEELPHLTFSFREATRFFASSFPVYSIWRTNRFDDTVIPIDIRARGEDILITRTDDGVQITLLNPGECEFYSSLSDRATIAEAAEAASEREVDFSLSTAIERLLSADMARGFRVLKTSFSL